MGNVIITGANRGIGKALLDRYALGGWNIWACARRKNDEFEDYCAALQEKYSIWVKHVYFELCDAQQIKAGMQDIFSDKHGIDALVNNAGTGNYELFQRVSVDKAREVFEVNFFAPYQIIQYVLKKMVRQRSGSIVNISSVASLEANPCDSVYGASKAALNIMTRDIAVEVGAFGIRANVVAPGPVDTDLLRNVQLSKLDESQLIQSSALKRLGIVSEIANVVYFLTSDEASFVNGEVIKVDGGRK